MSFKKVTKIITVLLLIATILSAVNMVLAADPISVPKTSPEGYNSTKLDETTQRVIGVVKYVCYAAAVILLVILGVRWLMAAPDQKADIKKSAVIYVVGAVLIFAAGAILSIIQSVARNTIKEDSKGTAGGAGSVTP